MKRPSKAKSGQVLIFLALAMVLILFVVLWYFDLHKILFIKSKARNAGDAAAVAGARWQGVTLNLIGEVNILQAIALSEALARGETNNFAEAEALADLQARLCLTGPLTGFMAAQQAAKNNGIYTHAGFSDAVYAHAQEVQQEYSWRYPDAPYTNSPSPPTAWDDYAEMLEACAGQGIAAACDNTRYFFDFTDRDHSLLNPDFYDAISTRDWCWFYYNAYALLQNYSDWTSWDPLPLIDEPEPINSEIFGLGLRRAQTLETLPSGGNDILEQLESLAGQPLETGTVSVAATWYCYAESVWKDWSEALPAGFPFLTDPKEEYAYLGADAAVRIEEENDRLTPGGTSDDITWTAAAKPFGYLDGPIRPDAYNLVLPAYHEVRLIPLDASTSPVGGSRPGWAEHIYHHLPAYAAAGPSALDGSCWYCTQLRTWEEGAFRQEGLDWLAQYSSTCTQSGPGSGPGGGTRRGH